MSVVRGMLSVGVAAAAAAAVGWTLGWGAALAVAAGAGLVGLLTFVALYVGRSRWREHPEGVVLLGDKLVLIGLFGMLFVGRLVGGLGLTVWSIAVAVFAAMAWRWVVLLLQAQSRGPTDR